MTLPLYKKDCLEICTLISTALIYRISLSVLLSLRRYRYILFHHFSFFDVPKDIIVGHALKVRWLSPNFQYFQNQQKFSSLLQIQFLKLKQFHSLSFAYPTNRRLTYTVFSTILSHLLRNFAYNINCSEVVQEKNLQFVSLMLLIISLAIYTYLHMPIGTKHCTLFDGH